MAARSPLSGSWAAHGLLDGRPDGKRPFEPGRCLEPLECLLRFGEQRLGFVGASLPDEPLAVLELGYRQVEDQAVLAVLGAAGYADRSQRAPAITTESLVGWVFGPAVRTHGHGVKPRASGGGI